MGDRKYRHRGYMDDNDERERPKSRGPAGQGRLEGGPGGRGVGLPGDVVFACARCGTKIQQLGVIAPDATCPKCREPLHTCTNCTFFNTSARFECRKPVTARIESKSKANACAFFRPKAVRDLSSRGSASPDDARAAFDALFKKD